MRFASRNFLRLHLCAPHESIASNISNGTVQLSFFFFPLHKSGNGTCPRHVRLKPKIRSDELLLFANAIVLGKNRRASRSSAKMITCTINTFLLLATCTMNLSLYSVNAFLILDTEGTRVLAKYYRPKSHPLGESKEFLTLKEQKAFEKGLWQKTKKPGGARVRCLELLSRSQFLAGDIILYDGHLAVYKHSLDLIMYFIAGPSENELMLSTALNNFVDALTLLLRNQIEKRGVLESLDLVLLCLDETIDDGCVSYHLPATSCIFNYSVQNHCRHGPRRNRIAREPAATRHDRDYHQRADDYERVPDGEGEDGPENRAIVVESL